MNQKTIKPSSEDTLNIIDLKSQIERIEYHNNDGSDGIQIIFNLNNLIQKPRNKLYQLKVGRQINNKNSINFFQN